MFKNTRQSIAALIGAASFAIAVPAVAQVAVQDGLVNVAIGDVTILDDVRIALAAKVAANICGVQVGPVAVLGTAVDEGGPPVTVCTNRQGPITIEQN